jgi:hypothetical protein
MDLSRGGYPLLFRRFDADVISSGSIAISSGVDYVQLVAGARLKEVAGPRRQREPGEGVKHESYIVFHQPAQQKFRAEAAVNRHDRRRAAKLRREQPSAAVEARQAEADRYISDYVLHLPTVHPAAPEEPRRVYHICFFHRDGCRALVTGQHDTDCTCNPVVTKHIEPVRS